VIKGPYNEKTVDFIVDVSGNWIEIKPLQENPNAALFRNLSCQDNGNKPLELLQTSNLLILCDFSL